MFGPGTIWILIPLLALLVGAFTEWLNFKSKQKELGTSAHELEKTVRTLEQALEKSEAERRRVVQRLENVEAIVTSEAWDALHGGEDAALSARGTPEPLLDKTSEDSTPGASDAARAAQMARRLNGSS